MGIFAWAKEKEEAQDKHVGGRVGFWELCAITLSHRQLQDL